MNLDVFTVGESDNSSGFAPMKDNLAVLALQGDTGPLGDPVARMGPRISMICIAVSTWLSDIWKKIAIRSVEAPAQRIA